MLEQVLFNKNIYGLLVNNYEWDMSDSYVDACAFTCRDFVPSNWTGINPWVAYNSYYNYSSGTPQIQSSTYAPSTTFNNSYRSYCGIEVRNITNEVPLVIGDGIHGQENVFDYLDYGIISTNSNLTLKHNYFTNLNRAISSSPSTSLVGIGIYAKTTDNKIHTLTVGSPDASADNEYNGYNNHFENCNMAINSQWYNNVVRNNIFKLLPGNLAGVFISNPQANYQLLSNSNVIDFNQMSNIGIMNKNWTYGIQLLDVGQCAYNTITYNTIAIASPYNYGIDVENTSIVVSPPTLDINHNTVSKGRVGIQVIKNDRAKIWENNLDLNRKVLNIIPTFGTPPLAYYGIRIQNSSDVELRRNNVTATLANGLSALPTNFPYTRGISFENSPNARVADNHVSKMGIGIYGFASCNNSYLTCNNIISSMHGFRFGSAIIGTQVPGSNTANTWNSSIDIQHRITGSMAIDTYWNFPSGSSAGSNDYAEVDINNNPNLISMLPGTSDFPTFCDAGLLVQPQGWQERENKIGAIVRDENVYDTLQAEFKMKDSIYAFDCLNRTPEWLNLGAWDDNLYQSFYEYAKEHTIGKFYKVTEFIVDSTLRDTTAAKFTNANIPTRCTMEDNQKKVNEIYLKHLKQPTDSAYVQNPYEIFGSEERSVLENVAFQNPLTGGNAVYMARAMLLINMTDDDREGDGRRMIAASTNEDAPESVFQLFPNPSTGKLTLDYNIKEGEKGMITFYDITGKRLNEYGFTNSGNSLSIDLSNLSGGVYFYSIKVNDETVKTDKLIILK